jgi:hypothetical protein
LKEAVIEARSRPRNCVEELVEKPGIAKGKSKETMTNFFDMKSRYATEYVDGVIAKIKRTLKTEENSKVTSRAPEVPRGPLHEPVPRIKSVKHQRRQLCPVYRYHGT